MFPTIELQPTQNVVAAVPVQAEPHAAHPPDDEPINIANFGNVWRFTGRIEWTVWDLIAQGAVALLTAASGTGKSTLAYHVAAKVANGEQVFGRLHTEPRPVLVMDGENSLAGVRGILARLGIGANANLRVWGRWERTEPLGPDHPAIVEYARRERPLLIWDSLAEFHPGDELDAKDTRNFMRHFRHLAHLGASVLLLHNTGKTQSSKTYRGSSDIEACVDTAMLLQRVGHERTRIGRLSLTPFKSRLGELRPFEIEYQSGRDGQPARFVEVRGQQQPADA